MNSRSPLLLATIAVMLALSPSEANAYIDPGTGSMLVQSVIGAIAAALVFGRTLWTRIKSFFAPPPPPPGEPPEAPPA